MLSYVDIGKRLQNARKQAGFTQEDVEKQLNISRVMISNIENGKSKIDSIMLKKFADLYGFSVEHFLTCEEEQDNAGVFFRTDELNEYEYKVVN
ncbi:MAG: helix-turn-helix transcriptional regulator, partial [Clostridiaceae bacterium]|nr:helix-turn-helix transcriptional regulator [Clostridiaceae bacterium]